MKNIGLKVWLFWASLAFLPHMHALDIAVTSVTGIDAAIDQANATVAVDRIVLRIPSFVYGTRIIATRFISQPVVIDGSELTGYSKYFPVVDFVLPGRDTSKSITLKGMVFNTGYSANNISWNAVRNNTTFIDCNLFNAGIQYTFEDKSVIIKDARKVTFKGCVFSYYLFANKEFSRNQTHDRISFYKCASIVFGGSGVSEANVVVSFWRKGIFLYKCSEFQFNSNYIGVLPVALAAYPIKDQPTTVGGQSYNNTNGQDGIYLSSCSKITIGGNSTNEATVIGNIITNGVYINRSRDIIIQNSKIGVHDDGLTKVANMHGITTAGSKHSYIGLSHTELFNYGQVSDTDPASYGRSFNIKILGNVISGNKINGIQLGSTDSIIISNNKIGTDISGKINVGNGWQKDTLIQMGDGINLYDCSRAYIGGEVKEANATRYYQGNIIGFNHNGIAITRSQKVKIENNRIGINPYVGLAIPNKAHGVMILDSCQQITVGPSKYALDGYYSYRNIIGGNGGNGVYIYGYATRSNWVSYNTFGLDNIANGHNKGYGVLVSGSYNNLIGNNNADTHQKGNVFNNNTKGHVRIEYATNNFIVLNIFKPSASNTNAKYIDLVLNNPYVTGNYGSKAPTITSIVEGANSTLVVSGTSVLPSELIELYSFSYQYGASPLKQTTSSSGLWQITLDASVSNVASILQGGVEAYFVALASCSNNCQGAFNPNASLYHNTSEFGNPYSVKLNKYDCVGCIESFKPTVGVRYVIGGWAKQDVGAGAAVDTYDKAGIKIGFNNNTLQTTTYRPKGKLIDGWQRIEEEFDVPPGAADIHITLVNDGAVNVYYDDIRIHPLDGEMKSYVYDPFSQKVIAELDQNNFATLYEYDQEGTLVRVKKETERGVYTIKESRVHYAEK